MLTNERHRYILEELKENQSVKLTDLSKALNVSESTIRRDLSTMEDLGLLTRIHGGAQRRFKVDVEDSLQEKLLSNSHDKNAIGHEAANLVAEEDRIFIDAGTTTLAMLPYLFDKKDLLVVTNGLAHAEILSQGGVKTILLGGMVRGQTGAIVGGEARDQLSNYQFNKAFLGINGIDQRFGLTTPERDEAMIKRQAYKQADESYVLADSSKFNKVTFTKVLPLEEAHIITTNLSPELRNSYRNVTTIKEVN